MDYIMCGNCDNDLNIVGLRIDGIDPTSAVLRLVNY